MSDPARLGDQAIAAARQSIVISDLTQPDSPLIFVNPAFEQTTGYQAAEALGRNCRFLQGPDTDPAAVAEIRAAVAAGREVAVTLLNYRRDGSTFWNELHLSPIHDAAGRLTHMVGVQIDVSERRRAEAAERHAEAERRRLAEQVERERVRLEATMAALRDGVVLFSSALRVRYCNPRAAELMGVAVSAVLDTHAEALYRRLRQAGGLPDGVREQWHDALARLAEHPTFEARLGGPGGRDVQAELFPVADPTDGQSAVGLLLRDVTAERDLARAKDDLISVVSHEIRTPLASIVGFAEVLRNREFPAERRHHFLDLMREEGLRLTELVDDFLDIQRFQNGPPPLRLETVDAASLLRHTVDLAGDDPAHPTRVEVPPALPSVLADADRVGQVLANLLSNARKYSPDGGEVVVAAALDGDMVEFSVRDRGLGLPPEAFGRLFTKFYRVDGTDRRGIRGTGLGLAICADIVEAHGGRIRAESAGPGRGARFSFTLPAVYDGWTATAPLACPSFAVPERAGAFARR